MKHEVLIQILTMRFNGPRGRMMQGQRAFTLMELLVSMGVVVILAAIALAAMTVVQRRAKCMKEIASAKTLIAAYSFYAREHDGSVIAAMDKTAGSTGNPVLFPPENRKITFMEAPHRYPSRLAPYFDYRMKEVLQINGIDAKINQIFGEKGGMHDYGVSLCPALGMNQQFCGGYVEPSGLLHPPSRQEAVTSMGNAEGHSILVFASAGGKPDNDLYLGGFIKVDAPRSGTCRLTRTPRCVCFWTRCGASGFPGERKNG